MVTFILIFVAIFAVAVTMAYRVFVRNSEKGFTLFFVAFAATFILGLACLSASKTNAIDGAECVAYYDGQEIYCDEKNETYFVLDSNNLWNPLALHERVYLDTEKVEKYIDLTNQIDELDVLGKVSEK